MGIDEHTEGSPGAVPTLTSFSSQMHNIKNFHQVHYKLQSWSGELFGCIEDVKGSAEPAGTFAIEGFLAKVLVSIKYVRTS